MVKCCAGHPSSSEDAKEPKEQISKTMSESCLISPIFDRLSEYRDLLMIRNYNRHSAQLVSHSHATIEHSCLADFTLVLCHYAACESCMHSMLQDSTGTCFISESLISRLLLLGVTNQIKLLSVLLCRVFSQI